MTRRGGDEREGDERGGEKEVTYPKLTASCSTPS